MRWPWQHDIEVRAADYTDSLIALLSQRAQGSDAIGDVGATAALEACSGHVGRALSPMPTLPPLAQRLRRR